MGVSTRITADVSGLKKGISEAQQSVKTLDAELKRNEAQLKATGDKEQYLADKQRILNAQMKAQKSAAEQAEAALEAMNRNGVSKTSAEYQRMQQTLANAQAAMMETSVKLRDLGAGEDAATKGAASLSGGLNNIGKKMSLDQAIKGIDSVTNALERSAQTAVRVGKAIGEAVTDSASWADDTATAASVLGMDVEKYQRYEGVFKTAADITVSDWEKAKKRVQNVINKPTNEQIDIMKALGIGTTKLVDTGGGILEPVAKDYEEMFWQLGERLREKVASGEITQDLADTYANAIFGKSFDKLNPIFAMGQEAFQQALQDQNVVSEEAINKLAALNDQLINTQEDFKKLQAEVTSGLAPALQKAAEVVDSLLGRLMDYLKSEDGQKAMEGLEKAVEGLFEDLGKIDPQDVVNNFASLFSRVVSSFEWLKENWGAVKAGLEGIAGAFALMKISSGVLEFFRLISGAKGIFGGGGNTSGGGGDVVSTVGKVGLFEGIKGAAANFGGKVSSWFGGTTGLLGGAAVGDYLSHNTTIGQALNPELGGSFSLEGLRDGLMRAAAKVEKNLNSFAEDWANNPAYKWFNDNILSPRKTAVEEIVESYENGQKGAQTIDDIMKTLYPSGVNPFGMDGRKAIEAVGDILRGEDPVAVPVEPVTDENAAGSIAEQIGPVSIPVSLVPTLSQPGGFPGGAGAAGGVFMYDKNVLPTGHSFANGVPFVPWDGFPAIMHRGERVMTAQQNKNYTYNNHNYFGSVNLNNGLEVDNLIDSINRRNRASQRGFGG